MKRKQHTTEVNEEVISIDLLLSIINENNLSQMQEILRKDVYLEKLLYSCFEIETISSEMFKEIFENAHLSFHYKRSLLRRAATFGRFDLVKICTENGVLDEEAIHRAIIKNFPEIVKFLLDYNFSFYSKTLFPGSRRAILETAIINKNYNIIKMLIEDYNFDINTPASVKDYCNWVRIVITDQFDAMKLFVTKGADINMQFGDFFDHTTALHEMITENQIAITEWLLSQGANPNVQDINGRTPLHIITQSKDTLDIELLTKILVHYGAQIHICNNKNHQPKCYHKNLESRMQFNRGIEMGLKITQNNKLILKRFLIMMITLNNLPFLPNEIVERIVNFTGGFGSHLDCSLHTTKENSKFIHFS